MLFQPGLSQPYNTLPEFSSHPGVIEALVFVLALTGIALEVTFAGGLIMSVCGFKTGVDSLRFLSETAP